MCRISVYPGNSRVKIKYLTRWDCQVKGNIVYIKRGGCSFTKKARMAQQAGAIAMVVANTDRYIHPSLPPSLALSNPLLDACVMISPLLL